MKKKILHLQLLPLLSGVQRFSLHLLDGLPISEYQIFVACKPGGEFVEAVKQRGWTYLPVPTFRHAISGWDVFTFIHLYGLCLKYKFDIVHTNSSKPGLLGRIAARLANVPLVIHSIHGTAFQPHQHPLVYKMYVFLEKLAGHFCDYTIFVNNSDRLKCLEMKLLKPEQAITIYNATNTELAPAFETKVRNAGYITIGSTLRFSDQKNVINLVVAACKACAIEPKLKFIFLGDGEHLDLCRQIVASHKATEQILLPGWDSEVQPWLNLMDAFVLYSRWEAMPYSIIEAMQNSLPIIGSRIPSIMELVNDEIGYLVDLDDETALAELFVKLAQNPQALKSKGEAALKRVNELCDYPTMIQAYRDVYERGCV